ncbi:ketimine reductase mu-crystallin [Nematostella vectensis]|uniref:ketimine reductase mu-crystallin n=1 Tax=Nematostella vectensis TaxID=45351 RepID=UPI002076E2D4|nr:ketimine reductase mu-crystallin [Nematostella vectensis]
MQNIKFIEGSEIRRVLTYDELIPAIEKALVNFSDREHGDVVQPLRSVVPITKQNGLFLVMPALSAKEEALATKIVTVYPGNAEKGLPSHQAVVMLFDPSNGSLISMLDGEKITEMRTAAASAVATKHLAKEDVKVLAILGSGVQARSHAEALKHVRNFTEVRVWSRTTANAQRFANDIGAKCCPDVESAVAGADVIVTATFATEPVLMGKWVKKGAVINAVGAPTPKLRELDDELMQNSIIVGDSVEAASKEAGDVVLSKASVAGEIGEVITGKMQLPKDKTKVFKSLGLAVEDAVTAKLVFDKLQS